MKLPKLKAVDLWISLASVIRTKSETERKAMKQWLTNGTVAVDVERELVIELSLVVCDSGGRSIPGHLPMNRSIDTKLGLFSLKCF